VEQFLVSDKLEIPSLFHQDPLRKRILIALNMDGVVGHLMQGLTEQNLERIEPVFDEEYPIGSTRGMRTWYTTKPCQPTQKSQISHLVADSAWEAHCANVLEQAWEVLAYAKNDHLGFQLHYLWNGTRRRFVPDFLIRLANGKMLILEIKGEDSPQNRAKRQALDAWIKGVNTKGGFGSWAWDVAFEMSGIQDIVKQHAI
jgi:type III restriction enzyme